MTTLIPQAPRINLVDQNGNITRPWSMYLQDVFRRIGGVDGPSTTELEEDLLALEGVVESAQLVAQLGVFNRSIQAPEMPADIGYIDAFLPRRLTRETPPDDAQAVICARVFAARN